MLVNEYIKKYLEFKKYFNSTEDDNCEQFLLFKYLVDIDLTALYRTENITQVGSSNLNINIIAIKHYIKVTK